MSEAVEILTPVGRVVGGHPMVSRPVTDDRTGQPVLGGDGQPRVDYYFGLAIPKEGEQHWNQTEWGAKIYRAAQTGWPNGEYQSPTFSWKVTDGDSPVPNKAGKKPCDREGWPGHWVLHLSTGIPIRCFHVGRYEPHLQIQNKDEIKAGDYGRAFINAKANNPSQSPGVYLNPQLFELSRAGQQIILDSGPDAGSVFGGSAPQVPPGAAVDNAVQQPAPGATPPPTAQPAPGATPPPAAQPATDATPPPAEPHNDFLNPPPPAAEKRYEVGGQVYTESQLRAAKWTDAQIASQAKPV